MPRSANGYSANDRTKIASYTVPGSSRKVTVRKGDVSVVLLDFAAWWHREIERIDTGVFDDWGYAERPIRGGVTLSNHASGTAIDLNATKHVLGAAPSRSLSAREISKIRARLKKYKGVLRWGGDYSGRKDTMHIEINKGSAAVRQVANLVRANKIDPKPVLPAKHITHTLAPGSPHISEVMALQLRLNKVLGTKLVVDGDFAQGGFTQRAVKRFKSESDNDKLRADRDNPVVGPLTVRELGLEKPKAGASPSAVLGDLLTLELHANQRVSTEKGRVSAWADARDGKLVARQRDEGARPRLTAEKTMCFTSPNAAAEACFLEIPHSAALSPGEDDFRVLVIARSRTMQTTRPPNTLIQKGREYQIRLERIRADVMGTVFQAASAGPTHEEKTATNLGGVHLYELVVRNGKVSAAIDGVAVPGESPYEPLANQTSPLRLGGVNRGLDLFAVLVIKGAATERQLTDVRTYLTDLYDTPFTPQAVVPAGDEQTKVIKTTGTARARIPAIVRCNDDSLVLFAEYRWDGSEDTGHIGVVARRSTDHGATWGPQFTIVDDGENTLGNPVPIVDRRSGRLHLLLTGNLAVDQGSEINKGTSVDTRRVYRTFSDDNGQTWAPRLEITEDVKDPSWRWYATGPGGAEQLSSGRLLVACNHYDPARAEGRSHVIFSDDHGETWQRGGIIETDGTNEIQTAELRSGALVAHMRYSLPNNPPGWKFWATSEDQGKTWTKATRNYNLPSTPVQDDILVLPDGRLVATNHQDFNGRYNLAINVSDDEGRTWPAYTVIREGKVGSGAGYADLVHTAEGRLAAIWEAGREISVQLFDILD